MTEERSWREAMMIDDSEADLYLHGRLLRSMGVFEKITAMRGGGEALDDLRGRFARGEAAPELILVDINMPVMDGWQFVAEFAPIRPPETAVVMFVTTSMSPDDRTRAGGSDEVQAFVNKPLTEQNMWQILDEWMPR